MLVWHPRAAVMASDDGELLPSSFDFIVVGTGLVESIVAGAFARVGYSVLHIDRNEYYGGTCASFNLRAFQRWADQNEDELRSTDVTEGVDLSTNETSVLCPLTGHALFSDITLRYHVDSAVNEQPGVTGSLSAAEAVTNADRSHAELVVENGEAAEGHGDSSDASLSGGSDIDGIDGHHDPQGVSQSQVEAAQDGEGNEGRESIPIQGAASVPSESSSEHHVSVRGTASPIESDLASSEESRPQSQGQVASQQMAETTANWTVEAIDREWRRFNLDLSPRLLYSRGDMVEVLISSDVGKYCEFKTVDQVLTVKDGAIERVPCSRADIFTSHMTVIEKRLLMRFMQFCHEFDANSEQASEIREMYFTDFLQSRNLSENIRHYILHAIAMVTSDTSAIEGLSSTKKFLRSLGRYGNTAFLWPLYGSGEIPQCFARLCAVFGGVYCLRTSVASLIVDSTTNRCTSVVLTNGQRIQSRWFVFESSYLPLNYINRNIITRHVSRAIILCDRPIHDPATCQVKLVRVPCPDDDRYPVTVLQLTPASMTSPANIYVVHLTRRCLTNPESDLHYTTSLLFNTESEDSDKPVILWSCYFKMVDTSSVEASADVPDNVLCVGGSGSEMHCDEAVIKAKALFDEACPGEDFLPKAPNPEDIVYDVGGPGESTVNGPIEGLEELRVEGADMSAGGDGTAEH